MEHRNVVIGVAVALVLSAAMAIAQPVFRLGPEFQVNTVTMYEQDAPSIATDGGGNFIVAWKGAGQDGPLSNGVFARRYSSTGAVLSPEFQINTYTTGSQDNPSIGMAPSGNFVVAWSSYGQDGDYGGVFAQRFNSAGTAVGSEFQVNTYTQFRQYPPSVAMNPGGDFVIVWRSGDFFGGNQDGSSFGVFGQRYDSTGAPAGMEFQINTYTTNSQDFPSVSSDPSGNFVVVWTSTFQDGSAEGVFGQRFDSGGAPAGTEFQINTYTTFTQADAHVASFPNGNFIVTWTDAAQDLGHVSARRYSSSGLPFGTEFMVNSYTPDGQYAPAVAADADGFVVTWNSYLQDGSLYGVFGKRFDSFGATIGTEFQINTYTQGGQGRSRVALDPTDDHFVVVWESHNQDGFARGIFGQRFGPRCGSAPATGCRTASKSILIIKQLSPDLKDLLVWKWIKGQTTTQGEFSDPIASTTYSLCVYDNSALKVSILVPAGGTCSGNPCWKPIPGKGFKYKDAVTSNDGILKVLLKGLPDDKSKALVKGKGFNLPDPLSVQFTGPVKAQLVNNSTGLCFEGSYTSAQFIKNNTDFFKAKAIVP